mmetsp:Transcript_27309/g.80455  ORF Transcript_27309/g.80455 Transcript_27309/m.80455 type:complete len:219 (-) Transcript_27309:319-975(-)|eukprot:CAMPEP_0113545088 /NCGR_PEP_ID=MMETSP0015_2-20120614/11069_1 /TAXON_ID=2838 /ORGANISM="Odontella" /LENGTH=218 /DNA_ID=CAMNT_0000445419 /DNA_START=320 /DNA_END=976 /DNA_ORIENTATION=+ /assembly_acc=CAM_ASM_000160
MSEQKKLHLLERVKAASRWTKTKGFKKLTKWAFDICDENKSGQINKTELYAGLILVHLNLAKYAGPAACYPPTRETVDKLFDAADHDNSGGIDEDEFNLIMVILCSGITFRIMVYYAVLIFMAPNLIQWILDLLECIGMDRAIMTFDRQVWDRFAPMFLQRLVDRIPASTLDSMPETLVGVALFYLVIPICWNKIDDTSRNVAEKTNITSEEGDEKID